MSVDQGWRHTLKMLSLFVNHLDTHMVYASPHRRDVHIRILSLLTFIKCDPYVKVTRTAVWLKFLCTGEK